MIELLRRQDVKQAASSVRFCVTFVGSLVFSWIACTLTVGVQFVVISLLTGLSEGLGRVFLLTTYVGSVFTLSGAALTLPLTLFLALAARSDWAVIATLYGFCGWLVMTGFVSLLSGLGPGAMLWGLLGIVPAAVGGFVFWWAMLRERLQTSPTGGI